MEPEVEPDRCRFSWLTDEVEPKWRRCLNTANHKVKHEWGVQSVPVGSEYIVEHFWEEDSRK